MKRFVMLIFSVMILYAGVWNEDKMKTGMVLGVEVLSQEKIDLLCEEKEFTYFENGIQFEKKELGYDETQNMLLIPQKLNTKYFNGLLECKEEKLVFLADEMWNDKEQAMASNYVFRLFRIGKDSYWMYNVYFTGMPVAKLKVESDLENEEKLGKIWVYDQYSESKRYQQGKCRFHLRGASSLNFPKPSYKVTFLEDKFSLLGMRKDDDWILNSMYDDEGLIHNKVSYELWKQIAASNSVANDEGISMEYIEVFLDNKYLGVYALTERVDKKSLGLNERDILYKGVDSKEIGEDDFYTKLTENMKPTFEIKYPSEFTKEDWEPLKKWYYGLDENQITEYEEAIKILNLENAIDYFIYLTFISGEDNVIKNTYYWADYQKDGSYQITKIPWDLNMTWGNGWCENHEYHSNMYQEKYINKMWAITQDIEYLYELNPMEIGRIIRERWKELREQIITKENIYAILDSQFNYIHSSGAYKRDCMFWGSREEYWSDNYIYEYTDKKIKTLDECMETMELM